MIERRRGVFFLNQWARAKLKVPEFSQFSLYPPFSGPLVSGEAVLAGHCLLTIKTSERRSCLRIRLVRRNISELSARSSVAFLHLQVPLAAFT